MKHKLAIIIILATVFGLAGGIVGAIVARVYILEKALNLPLFGELNFSNDGNGSAVVIRNARKVVVDQDLKAAETVTALKNSFVYFHERIIVEDEDSGAEFDLGDYYGDYNTLAGGFIITTDGWLISGFIPEDVRPHLGRELTATQAGVLEQALAAYVVRLADGSLYPLQEIVVEPGSKYAFYRIAASDLPVRRFLDRQEIDTGQTVLAVNYDQQAFLTSVIGEERSGGPVFSSDEYESRLLLADPMPEIFYGSYLFNMNGDMLALIDADGMVAPAANYSACISCLLQSQSISRPYLGINYVDLNTLTAAAPAASPGSGAIITADQKGIAVETGSPADLAGLEEGDIITAVDGTLLTAGIDLALLLGNYRPGDEIELAIMRGPESGTVRTVLSEKE